MQTRKWEHDDEESPGYNALGAFETTLMRFDVHKEFMDYGDSVVFCKKFSRTFPMAINMMKKYEQVMQEMQVQIDELKEEVADIRRDQASENYLERKIEEVERFAQDVAGDVNVLEGICDRLDNYIGDVSGEVADAQSTLQEVLEEMKDIQNNLADKVLLD